MKTITLGRHNLDEVAATAVDYLLGGGVVVVPTDTSYGLAADATVAQAVELVLALKGRPSNRPLSVVVADRRQAEQLARFSAEAARLWDAFMPGPLTLVLPLAPGARLSPPVTAGRQTVGLRQPDHNFTSLLAERFDRPYTATSANRSGQPPAYTTAEFLQSLPADVAPHLVVDAGPLPIGDVSTVVSVTDQLKVLREGAIPVAEIKAAVGP